ncbi:MAG: glycosyltransferase family 4 protein [Actinomycetota bacterium]|nr:glycosyltransferase family 4 protein [Actinomycetota bacterium]
MRVALNVEQLLYRAPGGIGRYTSKLLTLLPTLSPNDSLVPFTARHRPAEIEQAYRDLDLGPATTRPVCLALPRPLLYEGWNLAGMPKLAWLSRSLAGVDLIHAPSLAVPPRPASARLVVTIHDVAPALYPETFPRHGRWFHARGLQAAARRADLVITVSQAAAGEIAAHSTIGSDRVRVIANGVDATLATAEEAAATRTRYRLGDAPYVLWVGSLEPRKDVGTLVAAFANMSDAQIGDHLLVLAGPSGWLDDGLIARADRDRLGPRLRMLGRAGDTQLRALYAGARLFAFPSRHEGFGLPVLEAMVQGTPVVCADIAALREVTGEAARLVAPGDVDAWSQALLELLTDDPARHQLAVAGRARAAVFSWERTVSETRAVYAEALGQPG